MKKYTLNIVFFLFIVYAGTALEVEMPKFDISLLMGQPPTAKQFNITNVSSVSFRLLHGERFYSDLDLSFYISNILSFFHPHPESRTAGEYAFCNFSLNFPKLGGRPLSLAFFTGQHGSLTGSQYSFDFLKHRMQPVRMADCDISACFVPPEGWEGVGISFAGLTGNAGYLGASFGWNTKLKEKQEYGIYMQSGCFFNTALMNGFAAFHISDKARALSLNGAVSVLFTIHENFSIYTQAGVSKTNVRSPLLKTDIVRNIFAFFEPRVHLPRMNFDFTFFASPVRERQPFSFFAAAPLIKPSALSYNDLFGGLNLFFAFGSMELDKLQGGFHILTAMNITRPQKDIGSLIVAATPYFTVNIGPCDLDFRVTVFPLAYAVPKSMLEGKIAFKRGL